MEVPVITDYNLVSRLNDITLTHDEVKVVLKSLPLGKTAGPNDVSNRILKELADITSLPFYDLFNQSSALGEVPDSWKRSHVTLVSKSGDISLVSNHRPIALLSNIDKAYQSGFTPGGSTTNQLTFLYDIFCEALDAGK